MIVCDDVTQKLEETGLVMTFANTANGLDGVSYNTWRLTTPYQRASQVSGHPLNAQAYRL
jgi:hypothetical protein